MVISDFVSNGGGLIIYGVYTGGDSTFLNTVFGFSVSGNGAATSMITGDAVGTEFEGDPAALLNLSATEGLTTSSLPEGTLSIYEAGSLTTVALIPFGAGRITYNGWDAYDQSPSGTADGGWLAVQSSAVAELEGMPAVDLNGAGAGIDHTVAFIEDPDQGTGAGAGVLIADAAATVTIPMPGIPSKRSPSR